MLGRYHQDLDALKAGARIRSLIGRAGLDFASNDYLGLANSPELAKAVGDAIARGVAIGATGSRLLRGNDPEHEALETRAARFFGAKRCLFFGGGYAANLALMSTLPQRGDLVVYDEFSHASTLDGLRSARADTRSFVHNDAADVERVISRWRAEGGVGAPWIAVESVYSMDGDLAPLDDLMAIAERHDGFLVVDEAHATGVFGPSGRGLAARFEGRENLIAVHTCGKALGASGALVTADAVLIDFLINRARTFIFATAPSPLIAAAVGASLDILESEPERRERLLALIRFAHDRMKQQLGLTTSPTQIIPVILGDDARVVRAAARLQEAGFDCRAIRPPTVPDGTARLRIALTLNVSKGDVANLVEALKTVLEDDRP